MHDFVGNLIKSHRLETNLFDFDLVSSDVNIIMKANALLNVSRNEGAPAVNQSSIRSLRGPLETSSPYDTSGTQRRLTTQGRGRTDASANTSGYKSQKLTKISTLGQSFY